MWILLPNFSNISLASSDSFHHEDVFPLGEKYRLLFEGFKNWICFLVPCSRFGLQCQPYPMTISWIRKTTGGSSSEVSFNECRFLFFAFTVLSGLLHFISDVLSTFSVSFHSSYKASLANSCYFPVVRNL